MFQSRFIKRSMLLDLNCYRYLYIKDEETAELGLRKVMSSGRRQFRCELQSVVLLCTIIYWNVGIMKYFIQSCI